MSNPLQETQASLTGLYPFLGALLKSTSDKVICFNRELQITAWNPAMVQATGLSRANALQCSLPDLFRSPGHGQLAALLEQVVSDNKSQEFEQIVLRTSPQPLWFSASFYPLQQTTGSTDGGFALLKDSAASTLGYHRAAVAGQALSLVKAATQQLICTIGTTGKLLEVSGNCYELLGYTPNELAGKLAEELMHPDDLPVTADGSYDFLEEGSDGPLLHRLRHKTGEYSWFESTGRTVRHPTTGLFLEVVVVCTPLLGRKLPTGAAARSASTEGNFLELALEATNSGVWAWHAATEKCEFDNRMQQLCGLEPGTFDGRLDTFLDMLYPADRQNVQQAMRRAVLTGKPYRVDFRIKRPDNSLRYITAMGRMLYLPNAIPDQLVGLCADITDQNLAEQKMLEHQALLKSVLDSSLSGILSLEPVRSHTGLITDFTIRLINSVGAAMAKCSVEHAKDQSFLKLFPSARQEGIFDYYSSVAETGNPVSFESVFALGKTSAWFAVQVAPLENGLTVTLTNINEQKESQLELLRNKYFMEKVNQTAPFLTAVLDLNEQKAVYMSKNPFPFLGFPALRGQSASPGELLGLLHPDDAARLPSCLQQVASAADYDVLRFLFRLRDRLQDYRWHQVYVKVFRRDAQSHVQEIVCLLQEVDQSEQNKQLVNAMLDSSLCGIMAFESVRNQEEELVDFRWVLMNKPAEQMIGRKARNVVGKGMMAEMPGNLSEGIYEQFVKVVETGEPVRFEHYYQYQGCLTWFEISAVKMGDGFTATFNDITTRKESEWELLESKLYNEKISDAAPSAIGVYELETGKPLYFNRQLGVLLGYQTQDLAKYAEQKYQLMVHPDDQPELHAHFASLAQAADGEVVEGEMRLKDSKGEWRWMNARGTVFRRDADGNVKEILTFVNDVGHARRQANLLQSVFNASVNGICVFSPLRNAEGEITDFQWLITNQRAAEIMEISPDFLRGKNLLDLFPGHITNGLFAAFVTTVNSGEPFKSEWVLNRPEQQPKCLSVMAVKLEDALMVMTEDITNRQSTCPQASQN